MTLCEIARQYYRIDVLLIVSLVAVDLILIEKSYWRRALSNLWVAGLLLLDFTRNPIAAFLLCFFAVAFFLRPTVELACQ